MAAWEEDAAADAAAAAAAVGAALYDLGLSHQQAVPARQAGWSMEDEAVPMDFDEVGLRCTVAEQQHMLWQAVGRLDEDVAMPAARDAAAP